MYLNYYESAFPVFASSDGIAYEIYLAGCHGYCPGCHSPHTWDFNAGIPMQEEIEKLVKDMENREDQFDNIVILGGEPLDNFQWEIENFAATLRECFPDKKLYLYTHFDEDTVRDRFPFVLDYFDYIKVGMYDSDSLNKENKKDPLTNVILASNNQYFIAGNPVKEQANE